MTVTVKTYAPTYKTDRLVLRTARMILDELRERAARHEEEAAEDRKRGHRAHYCVHGVNMWVDHDCACYRCEDGITIYAEALVYANDEVFRYRKIKDAALPALADRDAPYAVREALSAWIESAHPLTSRLAEAA